MRFGICKVALSARDRFCSRRKTGSDCHGVAPRQWAPKAAMNRDSAVEGETMSEAQGFRSEVNGSLPPGEVASTGAMSAAVSHLETECRAA
jgi:hypothetical protein